MSLLSLIPGMGTIETGLGLVSSLSKGMGAKKKPKKSNQAQALIMAQMKRRAQISQIAQRQKMKKASASMSRAINDKIEPWNPPPTDAQNLENEKKKNENLEREKKKNETIVYIGAGVAVLAAVYFISQGKNRK